MRLILATLESSLLRILKPRLWSAVTVELVPGDFRRTEGGEGLG